MTKTRAEFEEHMRGRRAVRDAAVQRATEAFNTSAAVIVTEHRSEPELYILSGNMGSGTDSHRITFFMKDGPRGHHEGSIPELMEFIAGDLTTYQPVGDDEVIAWTSTPEFSMGSRRVAYVQALNELGYRRSKATDPAVKAALDDAMARAGRMEDVEAATTFMQKVLAAHLRKNPSDPTGELAYSAHHGPMDDEPGGVAAAGRFVLDDPEDVIEWQVDRPLYDDMFTLVMNYFTFADAWDDVIGKYPTLGEARREGLRQAEFARRVYAFAEKRYGHTSPEDVARGLNIWRAQGRLPDTSDPTWNPASKDFDLVGVTKNPRPRQSKTTPWVTNLLAAHFTELEDQVPATWLPRIEKTKAIGTTFTGKLEEFGCGAYGCVLPTLDPKVVLKVTSDQTEAEFAAELADKLPTPVCVAYFMVIILQGKTRGPRSGIRTDGKGAKVYLLWREEASDVGKIDRIVGQHAEEAIHAQHTAAMAAFVALQNGENAVPLLEAWRVACRAMGKLPELAFVSEGLLRAYDEAGIFISDTHGGNLGLCLRNGTKTWVITDPGNVVVMTKTPALARRSSR